MKSNNDEANGVSHRSAALKLPRRLSLRAIARDNPLARGGSWLLARSTRGRAAPSDGTPILTAEALNGKSLRELFTNRAMAVHVPGFCSEEVCRMISENALRRDLRNWRFGGGHASDVHVFGSPIAMAAKNPDDLRAYFENARAVNQRIRQLSHPLEFPLDTFRIAMDENWPDGMILGRMFGRKMTIGVVRVMQEQDVKTHELPLNCHIDSPSILSPKVGTFSVNIYMRCPPSGGDLYMWSADITTIGKALRHWDLIRRLSQAHYLNEHLQREIQKLLPAPQVVKIRQGDLVIINTGRPHAVAPFSGGPRVSLQSFIRYRQGFPLHIGG